MTSLNKFGPKALSSTGDDGRFDDLQAVLYFWKEPFTVFDLNPEAGATCIWHFNNLVALRVLKDAGAVGRQARVVEER